MLYTQKIHFTWKTFSKEFLSFPFFTNILWVRVVKEKLFLFHFVKKKKIKNNISSSILFCSSLFSILMLLFLQLFLFLILFCFNGINIWLWKLRSVWWGGECEWKWIKKNCFAKHLQNKSFFFSFTLYGVFICFLFISFFNFVLFLLATHFVITVFLMLLFHFVDVVEVFN